jgi:putative DNA primase/helicase
MSSISHAVPMLVGTMSVPEAAAEWFKHGWMPFPVRATDKTPIVRWRNDPAAMPDSPAEAKALFEQMSARHGALMIGIALPHSVVVLDIDHRPGKGWDAASIRDELARSFDIHKETPEALTPSGGRHLWLELPPGAAARNWTSAHGRFPIQGIDIRTDGGFVVVPPSERGDGERYSWLRPPYENDGQTLQLASTALIAALKPPVINFNKCVPATAPDTAEPLLAYVFAAYRDEITAVRLCSKGGRNAQLFKSAAALGSLVAIGVLTEVHVSRSLEEAAKSCGLVADDGLAAVHATIASGLKAGRAKPRTVRGVRS